MYESGHHPKNLQVFRIKRGVGRVHRQQGDTGCQLQAFNREFAISLRDDNVTLKWLFGFVDHHQVAGM
ncbi:hypothetical protein LTSEINV_6376 [Salmonella enterica subsp. enterica serovar Inverness str. R8-3668]|uniref:Uncharacterized protein n=1 Tax=Salmonella enterica subsp. enterica serovar Inverness str. R8-3668 TaxID=913075 RepID=G5NMK0_SALET|nr:hypothetical protein LTSEINV_6376 [Salmonella enterica subsp. enterica serovar Inverness str. R8-3668]